jgi:predicted NBD/HSP70 family sugar kinase
VPQRFESVELSPQARLRREHERVILRAITTGAIASRTQLAADHGLSAQSVGRIVRDLLDAGLVEEVATDRPAGPGAPRIGLRMWPDGAYALGFGLERDRLTGVLIDLGVGVRWQMSKATPSGQPAAEVLQRIEREVRSLLARPEFKDCGSRLCGLGIAAPGPIDCATGTIVDAPNFPNWQHVDVAQELGRALELPVVMDNDATAAAIGTRWQLRRGLSPFFYCHWGVGIGGGLVVDDEAFLGTTGNAMEIGHVVVNPGGRRCDCGGVGCLEAEASVAAILADAARHGDFHTVEAVVAAAVWSRPLADILTWAAEKLATALLTVVNLVDVDEVIIGGEHFRAVEQIFLPIIRDVLTSRPFRRPISATRVTVSSLEAANAVGAAALVFHTLLRSRPPRPSTTHAPAASRAASWAAVRAGRRRAATGLAIKKS